MHIEKRLLSILLVLVMLSGVLYGSTLEISREPEEAEIPWSSKKETIYVWYSDEALTGYLYAAAVNFSEAEGVRVIPVLKSSSGFLEEVNAATLDPEQQMPDAYVINNDELETAYLAGLAVEIDDPEGIVTTQYFPETALSAVSYLGRRVAYPFYFDTSVLLYNRDYLDMWVTQQAEREARETQEPLPEDEEYGEAPENEGELTEEETQEISLEEMIAADGIPKTVDGILYFADTFDAPEGVDGVMKWDVSDIFFNYWIVGAYLVVGGDSGDDKGNIDISNQETVDCLEVYKALNQFFYIEPDTVNYETVVRDFMDGKLVFTIGNTDVINQLESEREEGSFTFQYGITTLPQVSTTLRSRGLSVTNAVAVNGYSGHRELANRFAQYLTREMAGELYARTGKLSAALEANQEKTFQETFIAQYAESVSLPKMMEIGNLWLQLEALFSKVWNGEEVLPLVRELEEQVFTQVEVKSLKEE